MTLSERKKSISELAALSAKGDLERLADALDRAFDSVLTVNDAGEIFLQLYAYAGFPRSLNAQNVLAQAVKKREGSGKSVIYGSTPSAVAESGRYALGLSAVNKIFNQNGTQSRPKSTGYAETADVFLKEHLFSDIIGRDNMEVREREFATASMLVGLGNVNPQLAAHINGALNSGNSAEELREAFELLAQSAGKAESENAVSVLNAVLEERAKTKPSEAGSSGGGKADAEKKAESYPPQAKVSAFPVGEPNDAYARYFTGRSWLCPLSRVVVSEKDGTCFSIANVTFEPGCRNNWHIHHAQEGGGQVLVCTGGRGWYQEEGKKARALKAGDVVTIPANVKHWHGAAKDSYFAHLAVEVPGTNTSNEWLEPVTDEEYPQ